MWWSWRIGSLAGIPLKVHPTFLLLIVWVAISHWLESRRITDALEGAGIILALFACVVLHELGHALTARRYGITTKDITLLPIGGVARLERIPEVPSQEALVALAGPAVNFGIAAVLFAWLWLVSGMPLLEDLGVSTGPILERLLLVNLFLAVFNLLPAFPMDGGRVLRAALATRISYTRATAVAATVGQGMAVFLGLLGLFGNPFLVFIALFVWLGAAGEASMVQMRSAFQGVPVHRAMMRDFETLAPHESLSRAAALTLAGAQDEFPILSGGRVVGILRQNDLVAGLREGGHEAPVERYMCRDFEFIGADEMLESVFSRLEQHECQTFPVLRAEHLVGLLTMGNLGEFVRIQAALAAPKKGARLEWN